MNEGRVPNLVRVGVFLGMLIVSGISAYYFNNFLWMVAGLAVAIILSFSVYTVAQWEQLVVLRFGKFKRLLRPGIAILLPFADSVVERVDQRIRVSTFLAEQTLTKDTVPVDVDAVLFWLVYDVKKAVLEVNDYQQAVSWAAQTTLREVIGSTMLSELLSNRRKLDQELLKEIDRKTEPWGITVQSVELRDIVIPQLLQDTMSKEAQAERERRARILLSQAEVDIADQLLTAAASYENNLTALKLRSLNILSEAVKNKASIVVVPADMASQISLVGTGPHVLEPKTEESEGLEQQAT